MSDAAGPRKLPLIAIGAAVLALLFALAAVIVVIRRNGDTAKPKPAAASVTDLTVKASDVVALKRDKLELVVEAGVTKGVRIKDAELARALKLEPDDVIATVSGRAMDGTDHMWRLAMYNPTTVYVEVLRKGERQLVRWKLDGELREARTAAIDPSGINPLLPVSPPIPDPVLDKIQRIDDTTYKLPESVLSQVLADPMSVAKGARVVPAVKNGKPDGFKVYAVRPSSIYARLGLQNGDTIHSINGFELTSPDKALEVYTKMRDAKSLDVELTRRGQPVTLKIEITK